VAQKFHLLDSPDTFGGVEAEPVAVEEAEDLVEMTGVLLLVPAGHEDVVQVYEGEGQVLENLVHEPLKSHAGVFQPEWHPNEFE
jgi:hypothetical protein